MGGHGTEPYVQNTQQSPGSGFSGAGHLLAGLHADAAPRLARTTPESLLAKSVARAAALAELLPELREELDALIEELAARVPSNLPLVTSHGNFHAGQLWRGRPVCA